MMEYGRSPSCLRILQTLVWLQPAIAPTVRQLNTEIVEIVKMSSPVPKPCCQAQGQGQSQSQSKK